MSDITDLFSSVAPSADARPSAETVEADLTRGRQALVRDHRRRTIRRSMTATATVAAAAVAAVVIAQFGSNGTNVAHHRSAIAKPKVQVKTHHHHIAVVKTKPRSTAPIKLVSYTGPQPKGFTVDSIPDGWFLGGVNQFALTIDPAGDTDVSASDFEGKLAVLTQSIDVHGLGGGTLVSINGRAGRITQQGKYGLNLNYTVASGFGVDIQAPAQLNWSDAQLVAFAEGVHVTDQAVPSEG
jgi:hypothetical protein